MPKDQFEAVVALGGTGRKSDDPGVLKKRLDEKGVRTILVQSFMRDVSFLSDIRAFCELIAIIRAERPDVLHLSSSKAGGLGALAGRITGVPKIIFTSHGLAYDEERPLLQKVFIFFFTWLTFLLSHTVIVLSHDSAAHARKLPFIQQKIVLIRNGIGAIDLLPKNEACEKIESKVSEAGTITRGSPTSSSYLVGTIAELHKNKGLEYLIGAFHVVTLRLKTYDLRLVILGEGEERKKLEKLIEHYGLSDKVFLPGHIPNAASLLPAFDVFVLPSRKEGLPYVLVEAGQAGLPVIATRVGGVPEIIEHEKTGLLVEPCDTLGLSQALERIITDKNLAELLGKNAKEKIEKKFSLERMVEKTISSYQSA